MYILSIVYICSMEENISLKNKSGIYKLQSKLFPDRIYIGSSENLQLRKITHRHIRKAQNPYLKKHIKKYGSEDLEFIVIELCDHYYLMEREQYYISELNPYFNIHKFASLSNSFCNLAKDIAYKDINTDEEMSSPLFDRERQIIEFTNEILSENQFINLKILNYGS